MKLELKKKPKNVVIVEGFPGFGLVGTIATGYLIDHLKTERIGKIVLDEQPAIIALHEGKVVEPIEIHYNKEYNLILLHSISSGQGVEWELAETILKLAKDLQAKEVISIEGVGTESGEGEEELKVYFYANKPAQAEKLVGVGLERLKEGIIIGVTGALISKDSSVPFNSIFVETHTKLPDSKASAKIVGVLDKYLGLKVKTEPLLKQAEEFESKLKKLLEQSKLAGKLQKEKKPAYFG